MIMNVREKLLAGERIVGCMLRVVRNPAVCLLAKESGLDFVMFDCEHSSYSVETLHDNFILANSVGIAGFFRASTFGKDNISRVMDAGACGVMTPMTQTPEDAKDLVKWSKYAPVGERGYGSGVAPVEYRGGIGPAEQMKYGNSRNISIAQIESKLGVDNAEAIAAIDGVDVLLIGPNDLSISLGIPGEFDHPLEVEAIKRVIAACKKHGKVFGMSAGPQMLKQYADDLKMIILHGDLYALRNGFKTINETARAL
jgi:2-keto-3-deoxy-L-rhamnonate aldolase RhmA